MSNTNGLNYTLEIVGDPSGIDFKVVNFQLEEELSRIFHLTIRVCCRNADVSYGSIIDREIILNIWQEGQIQRKVHGVVTSFRKGNIGLERTIYMLDVRPLFWRLSCRHNLRTYQNKNLEEIIRELCSESGVTSIKFALTREHPPREYCVQYRETDLDFLDRLTAEEGVFYYHETAADGTGSLIFCDDPTLLSDLGERNYCNRPVGYTQKRRVREMWLNATVRPSSVVLKDYSFKNPNYDQCHRYDAEPSAGLRAGANYEWYDYPGRFKQDSVGRSFSCYRLESLRRDVVTSDAESDLPELRPGLRFRLSGHRNEEADTDWQVIRVVHEGVQQQALEESAGDAVTHYRNTLLLAPASVPWLVTPSRKPLVAGPQVAIVVGPEGEEIYCDEYGRVKIWFPWNRYEEKNEKASCWVRVSQSAAGGGRGASSIPHIGDEVIVDHLEGDPDQPLIIGRAYHAVNRPAYGLPENKAKTVFRSSSHKGEGFSELVFEEESGKEEVKINSQKDLAFLAPGNAYKLVGSRNREAAVASGEAVKKLFGLP